MIGHSRSSAQTSVDRPDGSARPFVYNAMSATVGGGLSYAQREIAGLDPHLDLVVLATPVNAPFFRRAFPHLTIHELPFTSTWLRVAYEQLLVPFRFGRSILIYPGNFSPVLFGGRRSCLVLQNANYFGVGRRRESNRRPRRLLKIWLSHVSARSAALVISISASLTDQILADLPDIRHKLFDVHSGRPDPITPAETDYSFGTYVLSVANDYPHKRLEHLARAWNLIAAERPDLHLVYAGSVTEQRRAGILEVVDQPNQVRVAFLGPVAEPDHIAALYDGAAAVVSASELEAHPLTPAEAGAHGAPLVLSDIPSHREVAGEHAEYVTTRAEPEVWAAAMTAAFGRPRRPWFRQPTWTERGRRLAELLLAQCGGPTPPVVSVECWTESSNEAPCC